MSPRLRAAVLAVALLVMSGCQLELGVDVEVAEDGSGSVQVVVGVDADGIDRVGGDLEAVLELGDLVDAGWEVEGPQLESDGFTRVYVRQDFANAEEAAVLFADIAGADGPFQDFAVARGSSFARTEWDVTGRIDFSGGLEAFGDAGLAAELDGEPLGQTVEEIEAQLGESLSQAIEVRVGVRLPGEVTSNATTPAVDGGEWRVGFGERTVDVAAHGEDERTSTLVAAGIGATCAALLLLYGMVRVAMHFGRRRTRTLSDDEAS